MKNKNKLTKKQIYAIPIFINEGYRGNKYSVGMIAKRYKVSWQAVWYWIKRLRKMGMIINTQPKGSKSTI